MNKMDAQKVIKIILEADGVCEYCVSSLLHLFIVNFNEYEDIAKKAFKEKFGKDLKIFQIDQ
ncbi:MAG: hypothetical protein QW575_09050 [Thermoproteota archaeon]